mmetsp:Transcript_17486/g.40333  ORF Transcript_17486/g.40333 Transcript_17486/m.40333 type:complete len:436 (+) Transcript_17486:388-1695(+)
MTTSTNMTQLLSPDSKSGSEQYQSNNEVQVDLCKVMGRIKPKPVCVDATLKRQSMSCKAISKHVFITDEPDSMGNKVSLDGGSNDFSVISSSSSIASRENGTSDTTTDVCKSNLNDCDSKEAIASKENVSSSFSGDDFLSRKVESERINLKVKAQTISRNGRQTQRWYTDPGSHIVYRMTTGCIPVMKDGKILFCSASRKSEWILPKGGWEKDEAMEESALRETFEEAGVFGIIGPILNEITFETRKGKKRRIEYEEVQRKAKQIHKAHSSSPKAVSQREETTSSCIVSFSKKRNDPIVAGNICRDEKNESHGTMQECQSNEQQQVKTIQNACDGDTVSVASETSLSHTHVKMSLFPLYVTEVMETWPEQGRFRKVVGIDEAIRITASRPYFQIALKELKDRNLHISQNLQPLHEDNTSRTNDTSMLVTCKDEKT